MKRLAGVLLFLGLCLLAHAEAPATVEEATAIIRALPEVKAYMETVEKNGRAAHVMTAMLRKRGDAAHDDAPAPCWAITISEETPERILRWHTFYIRMLDGRIYVDDPVRDMVISIQIWRKRLQSEN